MLTRIVRQHGDVALMRLGSRIADAGAAALVQELLCPSAFDLTFGTLPRIGRAAAHERRKTNAQLYDYERTGGELRFVRLF